MKKTIKSLFVIVLCFIITFPIYAFAQTDDDLVIDIVLTEEEFSSILSNGNMYSSTNRATGLIDNGGVGIDNDYKMLRMAAIINCDMDVVKCGFEDIIVQRRASSSSDWTTYHQFDDDLADLFSHACIKAVTVVTGYEYRVICTLYAKKNIFSVQRIDTESNILAF